MKPKSIRNALRILYILLAFNIIAGLINIFFGSPMALTNSADANSIFSAMPMLPILIISILIYALIIFMISRAKNWARILLTLLTFLTLT